MRLRPPRKKPGSRCLALAAAGALALAGAGGEARADDQPRAEELFERGRRLMQSAATLAEACRTLEESLKYMDRGDTVLNLAECHRRQGKTATAWAEFDRALSHGSKVGFTEAIRTATALRDALAAKLSRITVTVPPEVAALEGLTVEVDGQPWPRERWNTATVIDPGALRISAQARGYKPFSVQVELGADQDAKTVIVALEVEPPPPPPAPAPRPRPVAGPARPVWPWFVGGAGLALGAAAIGSEIVSLTAHRALDQDCGGAARPLCKHDYGPARTRELLGFGLFLGLGTGAVLAVGSAGVGLGRSYLAPTSRPSVVLSPTSIAVRSTF